MRLSDAQTPISRPVSYELDGRQFSWPAYMKIPSPVLCDPPCTSGQKCDLTNGQCITLSPGGPRGIFLTSFVALASNDTPDHSVVIGLLGPQGMTAGDPVPAWVEDGVLTLPVEDWIAITGDAFGLHPGVVYYLGSTPGTLTSTPPPGIAKPVGVALTFNTLEVILSLGVSGSMGPTTDITK